MRLLLVTSGYPSEDDIYKGAFLRARVKGYISENVQVTVLNFSAKEPYQLDGVDVLGTVELKQRESNWDFLVFHAPNLREHLPFLFRYWSSIDALCFTFHGHETLYLGESYPEPYLWNRRANYALKRHAQRLYDRFKIRVLSWTLLALRRKKNQFALVYVSEDFRRLSFKNLGFNSEDWKSCTSVIHNPVGEAFLEHPHHCNNMLADFITIRQLDNSYSCIDLVVECARQNPEHNFHIYGEGRFFSHNDRPPNVTHIDGFIDNEKIPALLNRYSGAIMPSRRDSHGVMMCEMAVTGMPLLASELPVHREVLKDFPNVSFLDNQRVDFRAKEFLEQCVAAVGALPQRFSKDQTVLEEVRLFRALLTKRREVEESPKLERLKERIKTVPFLGPLLRWLYRASLSRPKPFHGSSEYWEERYLGGGYSGSGSRGKLALYKAEVLNRFVEREEIESIIEFGCGDGRQLGLAEYPSYLGFDVSGTAVEICRKMYLNDETKTFALVSQFDSQRAQLSLSIDVIYHLVEDQVYEEYMTYLFESAERFVIIYSSNYEDSADGEANHVRHRKFSDWIERVRPEWTLIEQEENKFPYKGDSTTGSLAEFFIFEKSI